MDMQQIQDYVGIVGAVVAIASIISSTLGLHKKAGFLGKLGKAIDVLALNLGHAKNQK